MNGKLHLLSAMALCAACAGFVHAGDEAEVEPELFYIVKEVVKPGMMSDYEAAVKNLVSELDAYEIDPAHINFRTVMGPELGYVYVIPMEDFGSMDTIRAGWMGAIEKIGEEKFESMMKDADDAVERTERFHASWHPELSYAPETPALTGDDLKYIGYSFLYIIPGHEDEVREIAKKFVALYKEHGIDVGWNAYMQVTGTDLPLMVVARGAKSRADFHATSDRIEEILGEAGAELGAEARTHFRRIELKDGWIRPDLSYPPEPAE